MPRPPDPPRIGSGEPAPPGAGGSGPDRAETAAAGTIGPPGTGPGNAPDGTAGARRVRHRYRVTGLVQGVGYRPFVHRVATGLGLAGAVRNDPAGVLVEVEGPQTAVLRFADRLRAEAPPLARVEEVTLVDGPELAARGERTFRIEESDLGGPVRTVVGPDVATCDDCRRELFDPADRRFRYPFINCTNCGPRFTITIRLPYDRPNTTMSRFELCPECAAEYGDPADRRFHAQPVACRACGPRLWFTDAAGPVVTGTDPALAAAQRALAAGRVVAVKGLGGYHLACDARSTVAVERLRRGKGRAAKPLAVMVASVGAARALATVDDDDAELLRSPARPIVLLRRNPQAALSPEVAPGVADLGLLLPYTPVHLLLFAPVPGEAAPVPDALVMTSGNLSEEPICFDDEDARRRLAAVADAWLVHDRPIHVPCDDSVVRAGDGGPVPVRRSRGYAPLPVALPFDVPPLVATGGDLKNTFCLASGRRAWMSQHIGDMGTVAAAEAFDRSLHQQEQLTEITPATVVVDAHPGYHVGRIASAHAARRGADVVLVQHHHAHIAAVMAEHRVPDGQRVIGCAFDGTGYGADGTIWGGEVLLAGYDRFERVARLRPVPLPGGDATVRRPYRAALTHLRGAGIEWHTDLAPVAAAPARELGVLRRQLEGGFGCVPTSSMGRLFDAVASILGLCQVAAFEAQAAMRLEAEAAGWIESGSPDAAPGGGGLPPLRFGLAGDDIDAAPVLRALVAGVRRGEPPAQGAAGFHHAVATMIGSVVEPVARRTGIDLVALSGGVFQNLVLLRLAGAELRRRGLRPLTHRVVPPNDGGLALGQAVIAARSRRR